MTAPATFPPVGTVLTFTDMAKVPRTFPNGDRVTMCDPCSAWGYPRSFKRTAVGTTCRGRCKGTGSGAKRVS
jgi:hypothetical protein